MPDDRNVIDSPYAARELIHQALLDGGCKDPPAAWSLVLESLLAELPGWSVQVALRVSGLTPEPTQATSEPKATRSDNKSGHPGIDFRPGRPLPYRARVWRNGKCVWTRHFLTIERAADARAKYLRENP